MVRIARLEEAVELIVGAPLPHILEDRVDGVQAVPQELVPNGFGEQSGLMPVAQMMMSSRSAHKSPMCQCRISKVRYNTPISDVSPSKRTVVSVSFVRTTKHTEIPQTLCIDTDVDTPVVMQRQVPQSQTLSTTVEVLLKQATKHVEIPQTQYVDKVAAMFVVMQRKVPRPSFNQVTKHVENPQTQNVDKVAVMAVVMQRQVPRVQTLAKTVEVPPAQLVGTVMNVPAIKQARQMTGHTGIP